MKRHHVRPFNLRNGVQRLLIVILAGSLLMVGTPARADDGPDRSETVQLAGAASAQVEVKIGVGNISLVGQPLANGELLRGDFRYDNDDRGPETKYEVKDGVGVLQMEQKDDDVGVDIGWFSLGWEDDDTDWALVLNSAVPTGLKVKLKAADGKLALGGLNLTSLDVSSDAGDMTLDFRGEWRQSLNAKVNGDVGKVTLKLPRHIGVRVVVHEDVADIDADGLSEDDDVYTNDAYGTTAVTLEIELDSDVGEVNLELAD